MKKDIFSCIMSSCVKVVVFLVIAIPFAGCKKNVNSDNAASSDTTIAKAMDAVETTNDDTYMKAPTIQADDNGLISLAQCPEDDPHLKVELSKECDTATIFYDGKQIQDITDEGCLVTDAGEKCPIRFMDANFDGFVDIFIGQGESRTYSCLLLWDNNEKKFQRIGSLGDPVLQNFMLHPSSKSVIEGGSNSWCNTSFTKSIWDGGQLMTQEELTIVTDPTQYEENGVTQKFTVKNVTDGKVASADDVSGLPDFWKPIAKSFGE